MKIKVLQITASAGGIETYLLLLMKNIDRNRFDISLICNPDHGTLFAKAQSMGVKVYPLHMLRSIEPWRDLRNLFEIISIIKREAPSIVHAHSSKAGALGRLSSFFSMTPCLYTPNAFAFFGQWRLYNILYLLIERCMKPLTTLLVAASPSEAKRALSDVRFKTDKVRLFTNSIETNNTVKPNEYKTNEAPLLMMVGRLIYQKNPEMFVRVAEKVHTKIPDAKFSIIGSGFDDHKKDELDSMIKNSGLAKKFNIQPWLDREQVLELLANASILVVPSRYESFGYVAAEAGLLGKPVVATDVDGLKDIVVDGKTGFLVDVDDDMEMANKIIHLLENDCMKTEMGIQGMRRVKQEFDIAKNIKELEKIYEEVYQKSLTKKG